MILRKELVAHIQNNGCVIQPLPEVNHGCSAVVCLSPRTNGRAYLAISANNEKIIEQHAEQICALLGIPAF